MPSAEIGLAVGEPARFRFFGSTTRPDDQPGTRLTSWSEEELIETAPVETQLPADDAAGEMWVPVRFHATVTELGVLELWCVNPQTDSRWKLEFNVRAADSSALSQDDFRVAGVARLRDSVSNQLNSGESSYAVQPRFSALTTH